MRLDVLTWDTQDCRHAIYMRDDISNLQRMYYHLFKNVLRARWPEGSVWGMYPDRQDSVNWSEVARHLDDDSVSLEIFDKDLLRPDRLGFRLRTDFNIQEIVPVTSDSRFVQVADLFAGLAVFSRENREDYTLWKDETSLQESIFEEKRDPIKRSNSRICRLEVLDEFYCGCKEKKLGVSLNSSNGLRTYAPNNWINFWWYTPQHPEDKAPTKHH